MAENRFRVRKSKVEDILFDTTITPIDQVEGLMQWNETDGTLDLTLQGGNVTQQIGQELLVKCRNDSDALIENGTPVYISGRQGNRPKIFPARSDSDSSAFVFGVTTEDIADNTDGYITTFGYVRQIKTDYSGTGDWGVTWQESDNLYVSKTISGQLTNVEPDPPHHSDIVGQVAVVGGAGIGSIFVNIIHHTTIEKLSDVNGTPLTTDGQLMVWDNSNAYFDFDYNINDFALTGDLSSYVPYTGATADLSLGAYNIEANNAVITGDLGVTGDVDIDGNSTLNFTPKSAQNITQSIYSDASDQLRLGTVTAGKRVYLGDNIAALSTRLGVNQISPVYNLDVNGTSRFVGASIFETGVTISGALGVTGKALFYGADAFGGRALDTNGAIYIDTTTNQDSAIYINGSTNYPSVWATDGTYQAALVDQAGYSSLGGAGAGIFYDGTNTTYLANGTYAVYADGDFYCSAAGTFGTSLDVGSDINVGSNVNITGDLYVDIIRALEGSYAGSVMFDVENGILGAINPHQIDVVNGGLQIYNGSSMQTVVDYGGYMQLLSNDITSSPSVLSLDWALRTLHDTAGSEVANWGLGTYSFEIVGNGNVTTSFNVGTDLDVGGHLSAATKSFLIPHQTKEGKKLQYGVVESDQHSVFVRGKTDEKVINLPEEWDWLVDEESVTVQLTPIGKFRRLYVKSQDNKQVVVGGVKGQYNYTIYGERKDVAKLETEV